MQQLQAASYCAMGIMREDFVRPWVRYEYLRHTSWDGKRLMAHIQSRRLVPIKERDHLLAGHELQVCLVEHDAIVELRIEPLA